jgi:hypothetical protein
MADNATSDDTCQTDLKAKLMEHLKFLGPAAPLVGFFLMGEGLAVFKGMDHSLTPWFMIGGAIGTAIYLGYMVVKSRSDFTMSWLVNDRIDLIDREAQVRIYDGLQEIQLISEDAPDNDERLLRVVVNNLARQALVPSAYHNHHARELVEFGKISYIDKKKALVRKAFMQAAPGYQQLVINSYPDKVAVLDPEEQFNAIVEAFVCRWIRKKVIAAVRDACVRKIIEYRKLTENGSLSGEFKKGADKRKIKNETYVVALDELKATYSAIPHSSIITTVDG